jgi:ABC-type glutathione transport system ATPase component
MELLLTVQNLSVRYHTRAGRDVFALSEASLRIASGEIVGVLGESGSGKSTLATSLLAMFPPNAVVDGGAILLQETNLLKLNRSELAHVRGSRVSLIFQEPGMALHPMMRVGMQIEEVIRAHTPNNKHERRREVHALLNLIFRDDADRIYSSYPHQLSGGSGRESSSRKPSRAKPIC